MPAKPQIITKPNSVLNIEQCFSWQLSALHRINQLDLNGLVFGTIVSRGRKAEKLITGKYFNIFFIHVLKVVLFIKTAFRRKAKFHVNVTTQAGFVQIVLLLTSSLPLLSSYVLQLAD